MKKSIIFLMIVLTSLMFVGVQSVNAAEWTIRVSWTDDCGGCPGVGTYEYLVCLKITNTCDPEDVFDECYTVSSSGSYYDFDVDHVCTVDEQVCYTIVATVIKRCVIGQTEICSGSDTKYKSCNDIYGGFSMDDIELE